MWTTLINPTGRVVEVADHRVKELLNKGFRPFDATVGLQESDISFVLEDLRQSGCDVSKLRR